jgi:NADPH:quinone reductase-like Zn-dependent oxidoreductase
MRALTFTSDLSFDVVPDPVPTPSQALVQVVAFSLNFGEIAYASANVRPGHVPGWDAAGVIVQAAADVVMAIGRAAREATVIDFELAGTRSAQGRIENFNVTTPFGGDLAHLVGLLAAGELDAQVGWRGPWDKAMEAADALLARRVAGKAVLDL